MISNMKKVTLIGLESNRAHILSALQDSGILEPIELNSAESQDTEQYRQQLEAIKNSLKILARASMQEKEKGATVLQLDSGEVVIKITEIKMRLEDIYGIKRKLLKQIDFYEIWGDFNPDEVLELQEEKIYLQLFRAKTLDFESFEKPDNVNLEIIKREDHSIYFTTIATEKIKFNFEEIELPEIGLNKMKEKVADIEQEEESLKKELDELSSYKEQLELDYLKKIDLLNYTMAGNSAAKEGEVFYLQGWLPQTKEEHLKNISQGVGAYCVMEDAGKDEIPPTLLMNKTSGEIGEILVNIYDTPSYNDIDPSNSVFFFFSMFFAMIIADGGYGLVMLAFSVFLYLKLRTLKKYKKILYLILTCSVTTVVYGVLTASYFGMNLAPHSPLRSIAPLSVTTYEEFNELIKVMMISIWMGAFHLSWANIFKAWHEKILSLYGWAVVLLGALFITLHMNKEGFWIMGIGFSWTLFFTVVEVKNAGFGGRFMAGFACVQAIIQMFSDTLSYLRLFALGMASAYMGKTFNMLSRMIWDSSPLIVAILACPFILLAGHLINIVLSIMGGVIHGLRLNFIESYHWCFDGGGKKFQPLKNISNKQGEE
ncbi:MAG: V-type ATPase 116kDa subunit family protein [bacterium]